MPPPTDITGVRRLLGMVQFLARFVPNLPEVIYPIQELVSKETEWKWRQEQDEAFQKIKTILSAESVLAHYKHSPKSLVQSDASKNALSAALLQ